MPRFRAPARPTTAPPAADAASPRPAATALSKVLGFDGFSMDDIETRRSSRVRTQYVPPSIPVRLRALVSPLLTHRTGFGPRAVSARRSLCFNLIYHHERFYSVKTFLAQLFTLL